MCLFTKYNTAYANTSMQKIRCQTNIEEKEKDFVKKHKKSDILT